MATGYTYPVKDGKITEFREFALQCSRAFGALIHMREDSMSSELTFPEVDDYHVKGLAKAKRDLKDLETVSIREAEKRAEADHQRALDANREIAKVRKLNLQRYEAMLEQVRAWTPPTKEHQGLKDFMVQQLVDSIKWDVDYLTEPQKKSGAGWLADAVKAAEDSIAYHTEKYAEEVKRIGERREWILQLQESLK
jgi:hypothetical protein